MGLFSFRTGAGNKVLSKKDEVKVSAVSEEAVKKAKTDAMLKAVEKLKLPVKDLSLDLKGEVVTVYGQAETQFAKELVILTLGNNADIRQVDDRISVVTPAPEATFYEVKSGDTLSKIAKAQYGDAKKYNVIFEANTPMLKDPNLIYPGQMLRIPKL
jgi:nucleoid-associated protein YgaU